MTHACDKECDLNMCAKKNVARLTSRYKHLGQFAPLGSGEAGVELPGDWVNQASELAHAGPCGVRLDQTSYFWAGF
eukprot:jgi/Mesen1/7261/ME000373S06338